MPNAMSNASEPVGITSTSCGGLSPRRMAEPLPKFFSTCANAVSNAALRRGSMAWASLAVSAVSFAATVVCCAMMPPSSMFGSSSPSTVGASAPRPQGRPANVVERCAQRSVTVDNYTPKHEQMFE